MLCWDHKWYYDSTKSFSSSWSYANGFRNYYLNNVGSAKVKGLKAKKCSFGATRQSDLVQIVKSGKATHNDN